MLAYPTSRRPFTVMGIDPGTQTLGVSLVSWDLHAPARTVETAFTLTASDTSPMYAALREQVGKRYARLQQHYDVLLECLYQYQPHAVIAESPFGGSFPQTFAALTECIGVIRRAVMTRDPTMVLDLIDPMTVKRVAGVEMKRTNLKRKDAVADALCARPDITWGIDPSGLDEHSTDATAVAIYYFDCLL